MHETEAGVRRRFCCAVNVTVYVLESTTTPATFHTESQSTATATPADSTVSSVTTTAATATTGNFYFLSNYFLILYLKLLMTLQRYV